MPSLLSELPVTEDLLLLAIANDHSGLKSVSHALSEAPCLVYRQEIMLGPYVNTCFHIVKLVYFGQLRKESVRSPTNEQC